MFIFHRFNFILALDFCTIFFCLGLSSLTPYTCNWVFHNIRLNLKSFIISDVEGTGTCLQGSQMLWECRRLERASFATDSSVEAEAGLRLSKKILTCCWDSLLKVLAAPLTEEKHRSKGLKLRNLKFVSSVNRQKAAKEVVAVSLEGLQTAANLCNKLGMYFDFFKL